MLHLAICDDEALSMDKSEKIILDYNQAHKSEYGFHVQKYSSPKLLLDDLNESIFYEVFLLDMEMDEMSGITLATHIRKKLPGAVIVFLSSHTEFQFAQEGYKVQAIRYVSKLMMETTLPEALETAAKLIERSKPAYFVFTYYSETKRIPYSEILYIQKVKRMVIFHTDNKVEYQMKAPLKEIFAKLNDNRFAYVDQSTIVNMDRIVHLAESEVTLTEGMKLPVSRKMMPFLKSSLLRLWGELT